MDDGESEAPEGPGLRAIKEPMDVCFVITLVAYNTDRVDLGIEL